MDELRPNQVPAEAQTDLQDLLHHLVRLAGSRSVHAILLRQIVRNEDYEDFMHTLHVASYLIGQLWHWFGTHLPAMFGTLTPYLCPHCGKKAWPPAFDN
ncbi:hypothetical protein ACFQ0J_20850 [Planotetraspora mira]